MVCWISFSSANGSRHSLPWVACSNGNQHSLPWYLEWPFFLVQEHLLNTQCLRISLDILTADHLEMTASYHEMDLFVAAGMQYVITEPEPAFVDSLLLQSFAPPILSCRFTPKVVPPMTAARCRGQGGLPSRWCEKCGNPTRTGTCDGSFLKVWKKHERETSTRVGFRPFYLTPFLWP